jgi:hypothetical protein
VSELVEPRPDERRIPLAIRPFLWLALVLVAWLGIDAVGAVGPLDRARLGWAIGMPLTLLLPAVTGAVAREIPAARTRAIVVGGVAAICGLLIVLPFLAQLIPQCAAIGAALPIGSLVALGLGVALTIVASSVVAERLWRSTDGRRRVAWTIAASAVVFLVGGAILVVVMQESLLPPGTCVVRP